MFEGAAAFNQPVGFDTAKVGTFQQMFRGANAFDRPVLFERS